MNNNEEIMEEINDVVDVIEHQNSNENATIENQTGNNKNIEENTIIPNIELTDNNSVNVDYEELIVPPVGEYEPSKSKIPLLIILSILLVMDIAALVIYIIGIDKVLSFIK